MKRVTQEDLQQAVNVINTRKGYPLEPYTKDKDGNFKCNHGTYVLDWAYGAVALEQNMPEGTGVRSVLSRSTKRELLGKIHAFIDGMGA